MGFKCGIVGLPNVGKSTLFNSLTNAGALAANFPFATKEPNIGMVAVPDSRLDRLAAIVQPQQTLPAVVQIVDIAGLIKGASKGDGLGNQFLANIRECEAILHVLRCFEDPNIIHVESSVDPLRDKDIIDLELQLKDLETLEKRLDKARKNTKSGSKEALAELALIEKVVQGVQAGQNVRNLELDAEERAEVRLWQLLTDKPVLYVCNVNEADATVGTNAWVEQIKPMAAAEGSEVVVVCAAIEEQITQLEDPQEKADYLELMGLAEPGLHRLIRAAYSLLGLQTYFTAGVKEVRAWTIPAGSRAPQAAGVIHSDFEKGFIRAAVIKYADFIQLGSEVACKEAGKMAMQGKDYLVEDGDIMHFHFN
jgi:GTP-binding protein YchF